MAKAHGAKIYAEIVEFACTSDGVHIIRPKRATMRCCMEMVLEDADISSSVIGYVNGHGTQLNMVTLLHHRQLQMFLVLFQSVRRKVILVIHLVLAELWSRSFLFR